MSDTTDDTKPETGPIETMMKQTMRLDMEQVVVLFWSHHTEVNHE